MQHLLQALNWDHQLDLVCGGTRPCPLAHWPKRLNTTIIVSITGSNFYQLPSKSILSLVCDLSSKYCSEGVNLFWVVLFYNLQKGGVTEMEKYIRPIHVIELYSLINQLS